MNLFSGLKFPSDYHLFILFQIVLDKITTRSVQMRRFYLLEFAGLPHITRARGPGKVCRGSRSDIKAMAALGNDKNEEIFHRRFSRGDYCVVAKVNEKIVGYEWFSWKPYHIEERYGYLIPIPDGAVYSYDAFIVPEYRIAGIWIKFKKHLGELMAELNRKKIIVLIDSDNILSLKTHLRFGFTVFKSIFFVKVLNRRYFREMNFKKSQGWPHYRAIGSRIFENPATCNPPAPAGGGSIKTA